MPSTCVFQLNSPNGVYYSGQTVNGQVTLKTTREKHVRKIRICFVGKAKVLWSERENYTDNRGKLNTRSVDYRATQTYVENTSTVRDAGVLPPGTYTYTFSIQLPANCPTSAEGKYGNIRYALSLTAERPSLCDNEFYRPLTVLKIVDLNWHQDHRVRLRCEEIGSIGCWPCSSGKILYTLTIPYSAYAPGQTMPFSLHVQNQSMTDITGYSIEFVENWTFNAHAPHYKLRSHTNVLLSKTYEDTCLRQMNREFVNGIVLPPMPPTTEGRCIIRVDYSFRLEIFVSGCHKNTKLSVPIFIGNVPIRESLPAVVVPTASNITIDQPVPSAPLLPPAYNENDAPPSYEELQPPSFEEAIRSESPFVDPDVNEYNGLIGFRPLYPMYPSSSDNQ